MRRGEKIDREYCGCENSAGRQLIYAVIRTAVRQREKYLAM
jgi:hypothetical protein